MLRKGRCADEQCRQVLLYAEDESTISCFGCGQTRPVHELEDREPFEASPDLCRCFVQTPSNKLNMPQRAADLVKVMGFSHYHHKLVSPLLTTYGMDKHTGKARPLRQITGKVLLDCSVFGDTTFRIDSRYLAITGFGRDGAAAQYLDETLKVLLPYNGGIPVLAPLHVDGDGHCLVHAISRAVVGRELFWHPLRIGLKNHFNVNFEKYKSLLGNFINNSEWPTIIDECEPDYRPGDGSMVGLRNIHVFGLSNLLRRPIILLDSMAGMKTSADYAALFLPGLNPPMACSNKNGQLNPPLCLAWSSPARNHYIPLVPIKDHPLPKFPRSFLPKVWGFPQNLLDTYMKFDDQNCVTIGGEKEIPQASITKLTYCMDDLFSTKKGVSPSVVADLFHYQYSTKLVSSPKVEAVVEVAVTTLQERRLYRCIACGALCVVPLSSVSLRPGGHLYTMAKVHSGYLRENFDYTFRNYGITCRYDPRLDMLVVNNYESPDPCSFCNEMNKLRKIRRDGTVFYQNGDKTNVPVPVPRKMSCICGFKHWWDGDFHETRPHYISLVLDWNGEVKKDNLPWFVDESNPNLNSNAYDVATQLILTHFPGEAQREELHRYIVSKLLEHTKALGVDEEETKPGMSEAASCSLHLLPSVSQDDKVLMGNEASAASDNCSDSWSREMSSSYFDTDCRKRSFDCDRSDSPSPKTSRMEGSGSPKPSTSKLSPRHS